MSTSQPPGLRSPTSTFQEQATRRKFVYAGLILVLFTAALLWRKVDTVVQVPWGSQTVTIPIKGINAQATQLALREETRGDVELLGSVVRLSLTGSRGLVTCALWYTAFERQKKNQWNELELLVRALTRLQPHFITPWVFQSWNLSYNVAVEADRPREKYFYISRGIELLAQGERQNRYHPDLRWNTGFFTMHKIGQSDETNYLRSLLQLSLIPPNERDPARFWRKPTEAEKKNSKLVVVRGKVFDYAEFRKFCEAHPQLVRRLRVGIHKPTEREQKQQFRCRSAQEVVKFLQDNYTVPAVYPVQPLAGHPQERDWEERPAPAKWGPTSDPPGSELDRFPVLPPGLKDPERADTRPFDAEALTSDRNLGDSDDVFRVAHAWYCYAQEPLPAPSDLPGHSKPITNRARQKGPRNLTWLIFRNYPAQAWRYTAERLQAEGWFDEEPFDISDWFSDARSASSQTVKLRVPKLYASGEAWKEAHRAWEQHGEQNLLIIPPARLSDLEKYARRYADKNGASYRGQPKPARRENLKGDVLLEYDAALFLFEYDFYRRVSNFKHHYDRCGVEKLPATVAARKLFYQAEQLDYNGEWTEALRVYGRRITPAMVAADETLKPLLRPGKPPEGKREEDFYYTPLEAWRELVLAQHGDYRKDDFTQEFSAEVQVRYMLLWDRQTGQELKESVAKAAAVLPLVPKLDPGVAKSALVEGPFDALDAKGQPWVSEDAFRRVNERMKVPGRRRMTPQPSQQSPRPQPQKPPRGPGRR